jgi:hypothetical protein
MLLLSYKNKLLLALKDQETIRTVERIKRIEARILGVKPGDIDCRREIDVVQGGFVRERQ